MTLRALCLTALLLATSASPALPRQLELPDPYQLIENLGPFMETGDMDGAWRHLDRGIREAKRLGPLSPDWALVFAMLADSIRNIGENPAYALQIVEEGLDLARSGGDRYTDEAAALEVSRAYILADLGRMTEAAEAATLALPSLRARFGEAALQPIVAFGPGRSRSCFDRPGWHISGQPADASGQRPRSADSARSHAPVPPS